MPEIDITIKNAQIPTRFIRMLNKTQELLNKHCEEKLPIGPILRELLSIIDDEFTILKTELMEEIRNANNPNI